MATARYETRLESSTDSWAHEIEAEMVRLDAAPMEWQSKAAALIGALKEDGSPRYKEIVVTVSRQSGKTTLVKAVLSARARLYKNQRLFVTAQSRTDATKHLENLGYSLMTAGDKIQMRLANGSERIRWENLSTLEVVAPTPTGGHGLTIDVMVLDEVWALDPHVMAGIVPATIANPNAQLIYISTMGTASSEVWNALIARGRESVELSDSDMAYLEYSAESDADVFDESKWSDWMPALGVTQSYESIRSAQNALPINEFIRALGNRVTVTLSRVFPSEWVDEAWRIVDPPSKFVVGVDVNDEPAGASISTGHITDEGVAVRNIEWRYGTSKWVIPYLERLMDTRSVEAVVGDFGGPSRQLLEELQVLCDAKRIPLVDRKPRDLAADTLFVYDSLREKTIHLSKTEPLTDSFQGAEKRPLGDLWLVSRNRMVVDASPLISAILAAGLAKELSVRPKIIPAIY